MAAFGCTLCFSHDLHDELVPLHKYTKCALPTLEGEWVDVTAMCLMVLVRA